MIEYGQRVASRVQVVLYDLWQGGRGWILLSIATGWLLAIGVRMVYPAVLPHIQAEFALGLSEAGILITILWVGYASMQFPGGIFGDRYGERNVLSTSMALATIGVVALLVTPTVSILFISTLVVGVGVGLYGTTRLTVLSDIYEERSGTAIGFSQAAGNVGTTVLPPLAGILAAYLSWQWGFGVLVPVFVLVTIGLWITIPQRTSGEESAISQSMWHLVRRIQTTVMTRSVGLGTICMVMMMLIYQSFTGFYPTYLISAKGIGQSTASALFGLFFATAVVVQPIAGAARDRFNVRITMFFVFLLTATSIYILTLTNELIPLVVVTILLSSQLAFWPIGNSYVADAVPSDVKGAGFGLVRTLYIGVGAAGPTIVGILAERGQFDEAFLSLGLVAILASVICLLLPSLNNTDLV